MHAVLLQELIGKAEMVVAEKSPVCRKRGWMCGSKHEVLALVDKLHLALRIASPQNECDVLFLIANDFDDSVGESFPPLSLV